MSDFNQKELKTIETSLTVWIDLFYKKNSRAWKEKIELLTKIKKLLDKI